MEGDTTKFYVDNAGLIICHPFFKRLFSIINYLDDRSQFKDEESQFRAVHLLRYIAAEQVHEINEVELVIPKILCGMLSEDPIPLDIVLSKNEKDNANEVLQVTISRWDKLGNTNIDGLQNTFLNRNGVLEEKDDTFQITIETSGTDILLDYIPWNINIIKLPWLDKMIEVSWR